MFNLHPLSFIAPCFLEPKIVVQEYWKQNLDWDNPLPCDLLSRFEKCLIKDIKVPGFYGFNELKGDTGHSRIVDSLQVTYRTCVYFCIIQVNDIKISFIIGKSCLTPLNSKVLTIPKLELQAGVIASWMKCKKVDESQITVNDIYDIYIYIYIYIK